MRKLTLLAALALAVPALAFVAPEDEKDLEKAKCPVSGKAVDPDATLAYKGATLYFCCPNCPAAFKKDTTKFEPAANAQLAATGQAEQTACPISGKAVDPDVTLEVAGAEVAFCCTNCQGKVKDADEKERVVLIFANPSFEKAFEVKKDKKD